MSICTQRSTVASRDVFKSFLSALLCSGNARSLFYFLLFLPTFGCVLCPYCLGLLIIFGKGRIKNI